MLRGLFEGAQYNSEAWAKCAVYSRARTKQGRGVIKEIRYTIVTIEIAKKCGLCREKCGLCREKCGLCREKCGLCRYNPHFSTNEIN